MNAQAARTRALDLCRGGMTVSQAVRETGLTWPIINRLCKNAGVEPVRASQGRGAPKEPTEICVRFGCKASVPQDKGWKRNAQYQHCTWEHYFEDLYDDAERDAIAEGLTGEAMRERRRELWLKRSAPKCDRDE